MESIENDVLETINLSEASKYSFSKYAPVYPYTNEYLDKLYSNFDLYGKNVLTVAASGDQALYAYNQGARNVDLFDINCLTKYYYYLRIWLIKYFDTFYLDEFNIKDKENYIMSISSVYEILKDGYDFEDFSFRLQSTLDLLLNFVRPSNIEEAKALRYWMLFSNLCFAKDYSFDSFVHNYYFMDDGDKKIKIEDLSRIRFMLKRYSFNFYNVDLKSKFNIDKKYDVVIASNIHETVRDKDTYAFRDNLYNLLNENGIAVLSNINGNLKSSRKKFLSELFCIEELPSYSNYKGKTLSIGTILRKK